MVSAQRPAPQTVNRSEISCYTPTYLQIYLALLPSLSSLRHVVRLAPIHTMQTTCHRISWPTPRRSRCLSTTSPSMTSPPLRSLSRSMCTRLRHCTFCLVGDTMECHTLPYMGTRTGSSSGQKPLAYWATGSSHHKHITRQCQPLRINAVTH